MTTEATRLYLGNGLMRVVKGRAEDIGTALKARKLGADDGMRQFQTTDGDWITINATAVMMAEAAGKTTTERTFGFGRVLETA